MAMLTVEPMLDVLSFGVQIINDHVGIAVVTGREDHEFEFFMKCLQYLNCPWSDVYARSDYIPVWECDWEHYLMLSTQTLIAMD